MIHEIEIHSKFFAPIANGDMPFVLVHNDKNYCIGDELIIKERINKEHNVLKNYIGHTCRRKITYVLQGKEFGVAYGYIALGLVQTMTQESIFEHVCELYGYSPKQVMEETRKQPFSEIRQVSMSAMRLYLKHPQFHDQKLSYALVGQYFQKKHATAMHACKTVQGLWDTDKLFREKVFELFKGKRPEFD